VQKGCKHISRISSKITGCEAKKSLRCVSQRAVRPCPRWVEVLEEPLIEGKRCNKGLE